MHTAESFKQHRYLKLYDLISFNQSIFIHNYKHNKLPFSFNNMLSYVPANSRRSRDDDYNFYLPESNYSSLIHYPTPKLVYNWNCLPITLKSISEPTKFRSELFFIKIWNAMYQTKVFLLPRLIQLIRSSARPERKFLLSS